MITLNDTQIRHIIKKVLKESSVEHKYYEYLEEYDVYHVLHMIQNDCELFKPLINPSMYQQALNEFTKFGKLDKFPVKYVYQWFGIIMKNTAIIRAITSIAGHDVGYPTDEIIDACFGSYEDFEEYKKTLTKKGTFSPDFGWTEDEESERDEIDDDDAICQYLEDNEFFGKMVLPDGTSAWSDYGLSPLEEIIMEYNENLTPEQVLVLINRALDVTHQRGDLCSAFIEGGSKTLWQISNKGYINENKNGNMWLEATCSDITEKEWYRLMSGAKKISYDWLVKKIKKELPDLYDGLRLDLYNPYSAQTYATRTHYILTSSSVEYFINKGNNESKNTMKRILNESQLRQIVRESLKKVLREHDWDEIEDYRERPDVRSSVVFYFDPETLENVSEDTPNCAMIEYRSYDFPDAWSSYDSGDYWTEPSSDGETGECGGEFECNDSYMPDAYRENEEEIFEAFEEEHREEIIEALSENAEFY